MEGEGGKERGTRALSFTAGETQCAAPAVQCGPAYSSQREKAGRSLAGLQSQLSRWVWHRPKAGGVKVEGDGLSFTG